MKSQTIKYYVIYTLLFVAAAVVTKSLITSGTGKKEHYGNTPDGMDSTGRTMTITVIVVAVVFVLVVGFGFMMSKS